MHFSYHIKALSGASHRSIPSFSGCFYFINPLFAAAEGMISTGMWLGTLDNS